MGKNARLLRVEVSAEKWLNNKANWQAWEIELTGRKHLARAGHWFDNARYYTVIAKVMMAK